jgi:2-polyprenyl-6-methoxyphenol hydroxylase-like FAD-dependent oxidoreductase
MHTTAIDLDVLIVGAGPVGLFLANECARRGLHYRIIEAHATQSQHSKALAIFPRTLEIFDMANVAGPFLEAANRVTSVAVFSGGHQLAHMPFKPEESPYSFVAMVPQDVTERLLCEELQRRGGHVEYETTFVSAAEHDGFITATLEQNGKTSELTAAFVVGCDGAHSTVRHLLNLQFEGAAYKSLFILADIQSNQTLPAGELQLCPHEDGPVAIFPMSATRRRVVAMVNEKEGDAPSLEMVQRILRQRAPAGFEAQALHWSTYFQIHHRHVARLRVGRTFVAGDAAHIHSPFGGQGMNTGLHDVWNLAWKLDLAVRGPANEELLASYGAERLPVIKSVIETTDFMTKAMGTPNKFAQALRDAVIPMVSRLAPFQHAFVERLSELGIAYSGSPIVEGAGKRYFDDSVRGGKLLHRFLLVVGSDAGQSVQAAAQQLADSMSDVLELRLDSGKDIPSGKGITLVRPDGYIAYSSHSSSDAALDSVRSLLLRQTAAAPTPQHVA